MGLGKIRFIRPFLLIFGVHLNSQEFLGSKCKIFSLGAGDFLWLHCTIKVTTSLPPPPTGNIKKNNQEKNRTKINPLLYDSLPSCCISIYPQGSKLRPIQSHLRLNFSYLRLEKRE